VRAAAVTDEVDLLQSLLDVGTGGTVPDEHPGQEEKNIVRMRRMVNLIPCRGLLRCKAIIWHQNNALNAENEALSTLVGDYENSLQRTLEMLRSYAHEHAQATISLHEFYTSQLATERTGNLELRGDQAELQGRLEGLSGLVREALEWEDKDLAEKSELECLRAENRALRDVLGLKDVDPR